MTPNQQRVADELLQGRTLVEIAESTGLAYPTVHRIRKELSQDPEFQSLVADVREEVKARIGLSALKAADRVDTLIDHARSERVQLAASQWALETVGVGPRKEGGVHIAVNIGDERAALIAGTLRDLLSAVRARSPGGDARVIEAQFVLPVSGDLREGSAD